MDRLTAFRDILYMGRAKTVLGSTIFRSKIRIGCPHMAQGRPDPTGPKWVGLLRSTGRAYAPRPGGRPAVSGPELRCAALRNASGLGDISGPNRLAATFSARDQDCVKTQTSASALTRAAEDRSRRRSKIVSFGRAFAQLVTMSPLGETFGKASKWALCAAKSFDATVFVVPSQASRMNRDIVSAL